MTEALQKLLDNGVLQTGIWETVYMTIPCMWIMIFIQRMGCQ
jgi:hypothetical protein